MSIHNDQQKRSDTPAKNRSIRIFLSSTFRDMMEERDVLMTHTWPELRQFCRERQVEIVEVDLRWGITEEQSTRKETLKLCLDEIRVCRPFFIGILGERYGWMPTDDAFTADLKEEQPWIEELYGKSVTELEILHGVLKNPEMAGRAFFYFRDPEYAQEHGINFLPENDGAAEMQTDLKNRIRATCSAKNIPLHEKYTDPKELATLILEQLKKAIDQQFPKDSIPDPLDREALEHEAFAEIRRRTYIGSPDYFDTLNKHIAGEGAPLVLIGESGSGKSSLLANWIHHHLQTHPEDYIFQHYVGGSPDSADHWKLMTRLVAEIKRWTDDPDELPSSNDDLLRDFPLWLSKARIKAQRNKLRFIVILDALNQLEDKEYCRLLGWLPDHPFIGALRLIVSTRATETLEVIEKRNWKKLIIRELTEDERRRISIEYLKRFGKKLDSLRLDRITKSTAASNPLYLKTLIDELRITGTHEQLDEKLNYYLEANDIPTLLAKVLHRYKNDYEHDRKNLVSDALGLIWAARQGLTETELMQLLRPAHLPQLPKIIWTPLRAALEDGLVNRGGILSFSHDFLHTAVETVFLPDLDTIDNFRITLADYFECQHPDERNSDELPWLLLQVEMFERLRNCLLDIDHFMEICKRDEGELLRYWVFLNEEGTMGAAYLDSFMKWFEEVDRIQEWVSLAANELGMFLNNAAFHKETEFLYRLSLRIDEECFGQSHPRMARGLNNLAGVFISTNRLGEAEPLFRRALHINEHNFGKNHRYVGISLNNLADVLERINQLDEAEKLFRRALQIYEGTYGNSHANLTPMINNLAGILNYTNRHVEAEPMMLRALKIDEESFGENHPNVANDLRRLAGLFIGTNRLAEAERIMTRALKIDEETFGGNHPSVASDLLRLAGILNDTSRHIEAESLMLRALKIYEETFDENHPSIAAVLSTLGHLYFGTNRFDEAEPLFKRALQINEKSFGVDHPNVARDLNNMAGLLQATNRLGEIEPLFRRALQINEKSFGNYHPNVAIVLRNLAGLLKTTNRLDEAEPLFRRALNINEKSFGNDHPDVAIDLNNLAGLLTASDRLDEAEPLAKRQIEIFIHFTSITGHTNPYMQKAIKNYTWLLQELEWSEKQITNHLKKMGLRFKM